MLQVQRVLCQKQVVGMEWMVANMGVGGGGVRRLDGGIEGVESLQRRGGPVGVGGVRRGCH